MNVQPIAAYRWAQKVLFETWPTSWPAVTWPWPTLRVPQFTLAYGFAP